MYIADLPIHKRFWEPFMEHIEKCFAKNEVERVPGTFIYRMTWRAAKMYVIAKKVNGYYHVYGWYYLVRRKNWEAWEIYQSYIFTDHRGDGWSKKLHHAIINIDGLMLASGPQQTKLARRMWRHMVHNNDYDIWAHDFKNLNSCAQVTYDPENDELDCALRIYDEKTDKDATRRDVRLIAIRKLHGSAHPNNDRNGQREIH